MLENKYIVLKQSQQEYMAVEIDATPSNRHALSLVFAPKRDKVDVGDIVVESVDKDYVIKRYYGCESAIVTSANMINGEDISKSYKLICAFSKEFGDIRMSLKTSSPFFYTERGDEILVKKYNDVDRNPLYKIVTNKTVDGMRAKFLQQQKQK